jgi:hypothetical protein
MDYARARAGLLSWAHGTPMPSSNQAYLPNFHPRHYFDSVEQWVPTRSNVNANYQTDKARGVGISDLVLLTWNIDHGPRPQCL